MFDWIPNLHPIVVHFPIALLAAAVATDVVVLVMKRETAAAVSWLYAAGTAGLLAAFFTGRAAVDAVLIPPASQAIHTDHAARIASLLMRMAGPPDRSALAPRPARR